MKILLTGASSFTGAWFARGLADAGHDVTATYRSAKSGYDGVRADRVAMLGGVVTPVWETEFGDEAFLSTLRTGGFDMLCHHAAEMTDYRSWDFDAIGATQKNTREIRGVLAALADGGGDRLIVTGSVFEPFEGYGDPLKRAFNPYGLSKHLSFEVCRMEAEKLGVHADKFVISNPFGPFEEARFTTYLAREWLAGRTPSVRTPAYIRDNIHVSLLARAYTHFAENRPHASGTARLRPSGYVESQGDFAHRVARAAGPRLGIAAPVETPKQTVFDEPLVRINAIESQPWATDWDEGAAWDEACGYWRTA